MPLTIASPLTPFFKFTHEAETGLPSRPETSMHTSRRPVWPFAHNGNLAVVPGIGSITSTGARRLVASRWTEGRSVRRMRRYLTTVTSTAFRLLAPFVPLIPSILGLTLQHRPSLFQPIPLSITISASFLNDVNALPGQRD